MSDRPKGLRDSLFEEGTRLLSRAAGAMLSDRRGQRVLAAALGAAQRQKERFEKAQEALLHALGLPAKEDYGELAKRIARLKRRLRELDRRLEEEGDGAEEPGTGKSRR